MKRPLLLMAAFVLGVGCRKLPETGRRQLNVVPNGYMNDLGVQSYRQVRRESNIITTGRDAEILEAVKDRIATAADNPDYKWRATLFRDNQTVNAWCMPGGKIGFYTGILPILENEAGMAFVMGHEVAHATLRHGAERMSQQLVTVGGLGALSLYLSNREAADPQMTTIVLSVLGLGAQVGVLLPYSRLHESEADRVGLMYMAKAGYPPQESIKVWNRMQKNSGGDNPLEFLSTHPSYQTRRQELNQRMGRANRLYENNRNRTNGRNVQQTIWR
ncbi:MAG: M48 family metallopeptidase [Myxococcota bacterium]